MRHGQAHFTRMRRQLCTALLITVCVLAIIAVYLHSNQTTSDAENAVNRGFFNGPDADFSVIVVGRYRVYPFLLRRGKTEERATLSLVSHSTLEHLPLLPALAKRWRGPISLALFVPYSEVREAVLRVQQLRKCDADVEHFVDVHLVTILSTPEGQTAETINKEVFNAVNLERWDEPEECGIIGQLNSSRKSKRENNYDHHSSYPNNLLRNIGRKYSRAEYVFVIDIDMVPSAGLHSAFTKFVTARRSAQTDSAAAREVFVVPAFEIDIADTKDTHDTHDTHDTQDTQGKVGIPRTKTELLTLLDRYAVRPFYFAVCWKCQQPTGYETWRNAPSADPAMAISHHVEWQDPWEPFFIAHHTAPLYDERFQQYGFNRISQACELHIAGYAFAVLGDAFLVHRGFKTVSAFHQTKLEELTRNRALFSAFKKELENRYPESKRRCW